MTDEIATEDEPARRSIGAKRNPDSAEAILEAAEELLRDKGYAGFSIEAVAKRARAGKPTIYRWWPNKTALLLEVYQRQKGQVDYSDTGSIEEDMFRFMKSLFHQWRETQTGEIFRSLVAEAQQDDAALKALAHYAGTRRGRTRQIVERAQKRGEVRADVMPEVVADLLAAYAWIHLLTDRLYESDETIRAAVAVIANGIKS
ncbi:MAG TPA: TetR/AcrR family transcriptional regulator [Rhizobiaceae bacterium]|nr:TetR/AcrR family transcriptional regulator [Rhizobiaceae bacterium]